MKRSYQEINWPAYFALVERKQQRRAQRKDLYCLIRFLSLVVFVIVIVSEWRRI